MSTRCNQGYTVAVTGKARSRSWVLLCYRLPREPSTPRITVWRKLKRLGVAQLVDGLVGLPADARTKEQLEWLAAEIVEYGGDASVWVARPNSPQHEQDLAAAMAAARSAEYLAIVDEAATATRADAREQKRIGQRLQAELRRIERRDFYPPAERDEARQAVRSLHQADTVESRQS
jgi:hypothetical protein